MREIGFQRTYIFKIFRGSMPPDPPRKVRLRRTITFSITYEHPLENFSYAPVECQSTQISIVSAILRDTVLTSIRARCAWGSGSVIAPVMEMQTLTVAGVRLPASTLRKCQNLRSRSQSSLILMEQKVAA